MTPEELDYLEVAKAEIRAIFELARTRVAGWEPAPCPADGDETPS